MNKLIEKIKAKIATLKYEKERLRRILGIKKVIKSNLSLCYLGNHFAFGGGFAPPMALYEAMFGKPPKMSKQEYNDNMRKIEYLRELDKEYGGVNVMANLIHTLGGHVEIHDLGRERDKFNIPGAIDKYWDEAVNSLNERYKGK